MDLEAATKKELLDQLQEIIWEVKTTNVDGRRKTTVDRGMWRRLSDLDRARLAQDYVALREASPFGANQALADSRGWTKTFAIDCVVRLRGLGYITPASEAPALTTKAMDLLAGEEVTEP